MHNIHCSKVCMLDFKQILLVDKASSMSSKVNKSYAVTSITEQIC